MFPNVKSKGVLTFDIFQPSPRLDVLNAIREDLTPNLLLMRYALATWEVRDLLLIPSFMFSESAVIKRLVALKPEVKAESRLQRPRAASTVRSTCYARPPQ